MGAKTIPVEKDILPTRARVVCMLHVFAVSTVQRFHQLFPAGQCESESFLSEIRLLESDLLGKPKDKQP